MKNSTYSLDDIFQSIVDTNKKNITKQLTLCVFLCLLTFLLSSTQPFGIIIGFFLGSNLCQLFLEISTRKKLQASTAPKVSLITKHINETLPIKEESVLIPAYSVFSHNYSYYKEIKKRTLGYTRNDCTNIKMIKFFYIRLFLQSLAQYNFSLPTHLLMKNFTTPFSSIALLMHQSATNKKHNPKHSFFNFMDNDLGFPIFHNPTNIKEGVSNEFLKRLRLMSHEEIQLAQEEMNDFRFFAFLIKYKISAENIKQNVIRLALHHDSYIETALILNQNKLESKDVDYLLDVKKNKLDMPYKDSNLSISRVSMGFFENLNKKQLENIINNSEPGILGKLYNDETKGFVCLKGENKMESVLFIDSLLQKSHLEKMINDAPNSDKQVETVGITRKRKKI